MANRILVALQFLTSLLFVACSVTCSVAKAADKPNVILIVADDQGYGDISCHGNPVLKTPNMDRLYAESVRLTDFHVAPMCSPTRGQLMTGRDAMKNGCTAVCQGRSMMRAELPTMANFFAGSGYSTGHFGKWHLGDSAPHRPQDRGFQETIHHRAWGITSLADHWENHTDAYFNPILSHNGVDKKFSGYCTDIFFDEAMNWIEQQQNQKPFFVYLPTNTPHVPDICAEKYSTPYEGTYQDGKPIPAKFYGMIANLDENVGRLDAFLADQNLRDNTIVIYMSDNGTQSTRAKEIFNAGMREKKTSVFEGGHRVPCFIRWPNGKLKHDSDVNQLTQVQDLLPTLIELCGLDVSGKALAAGSSSPQIPAASDIGSQGFDGSSLAGLLKGTTDELPDRKLVIQYRVSGEKWSPAVVLWDKWRLVGPEKLYNVADDPHQDHNVADQHPNIAQQMEAYYDDWHAEAKPLFDRPRWITIGSNEENPQVLYAQDWVGDYCDNPGGLSSGTAHGYWNVDLARDGQYEIELRRWPKESNKTLTEGWAKGPGGTARSAKPIAAANLSIAGKNYTLDTNPKDAHATFRVELPAGKTRLSTLFLNAQDRSICSAMYVYLRRLNEGTEAQLTLISDRKTKGRASQDRTKGNAGFKTRPDDILIADFNGGDYGGWKTTGDAFGTAPAKGTLPGQMMVSGFLGKGLVSSFFGRDKSTGTLTSPTFQIERPYINFLVGGGRWKETCINLIIDGKVVRSTSGSNPGGNKTERLEPATWNVKEFVGKKATIRMVDNHKDGWGHINVDHLVQSKTAAVKPVVLLNLERKLQVDQTHLIVPVANKGNRQLLGIYDGDRLVQNFTVALPQGNAPYWLAAYPLEHFGLSGKTIRVAPVERKRLPESYAGAFDRIRVGEPSDAHHGSDYDQPYRDQFHVSNRRGWNNDPNGMVYHDGKYHLYFQHNPFGIGWGNMHWGHFESTDLLHWEEKPIALYQKTTSDMMFSGGGFVDSDNSAGLGKDTLFVAFTSTGRGECLAYSKDGGITFTELKENPVVEHKGRDPKIIWYEPGQKWVMAVYDSDPCAETKANPARKGTPPNRTHNNIAFWESKDLRNWNRTGAFTHADRDSVHECPELFELPLEGKPDESRWILYGAQNRYFIGEFDGKTFQADSGPHGDPREPQKVGPSGGRGTMYAAQTFSDSPDGRRIQMGWVRTAPDLQSYPDQIVSQSMSLPHELILRETDHGLRLFYSPVAELENLRARLLSEDADGLATAEGKLAEVLIEFEKAGTHKLTINGIDASFDGRSARIFSDRNTNEVYIDGGLEYRTYRREPSQTGSSETKVGSETAIKSLKVFQLKSIWKAASAMEDTARSAPDSKPNIILIVADDLGYGDLGCYGSKLNSTPNIDRLAEQGVRLTDFHMSSWCAPSRRGLMTGWHANRKGLNLAKRITMAEMLKEQDYATALIGKWHLGMNTGFHPLDQGFDYWFGTKGSNDWDGPGYNYEHFRDTPEEGWKTPLYQDRETLGVCPQSHFTRRYTEETIRLIKENKDTPFFIYLAHNMPHVPIFASEKFKGKSKNGVYGDVLLELDHYVGKVTEALEETGLSKKTLVIFTSDNGPWTMFPEFAGVAGPLRGEKGTTWEGGGRVPCIFHWPGTINPATNSEFIVNLDLYSTLASLTGAKIKEGEAIDSHDMSNVLLSGAKSPRTKHVYFYHRPMAWRNGDYKIHFETRDRIRDPMTGAREKNIALGSPLLFNIKNDREESRNIAANHPEIVERLATEFQDAVEALKNGESYD